MTEFESDVKLLSYSRERVYNKLSDLNNLNEFISHLPANKVSDLSFDSDTLSFSVSPFGQLVLKVVERKPSDFVRLETTASPFPFNICLYITAASDTECKLRATVAVELNPFMKKMLEKYIKDGLVKVLDLLAKIQY